MTTSYEPTPRRFGAAGVARSSYEMEYAVKPSCRACRTCSVPTTYAPVRSRRWRHSISRANADVVNNPVKLVTLTQLHGTRRRQVGAMRTVAPGSNKKKGNIRTRRKRCIVEIVAAKSSAIINGFTNCG
jgi:hypothetical protein